MKSLVQGIHHLTLCPGGAQQDIDFFTQVLGQRLVKQTVLMDGNIPIYHFYYGNADADVGSIATCFPYSRKPGRAGSGQLSCTSYTVPNGAIAFW
jgi:glyoxalase family protein